jgi:fucose permease
MQVLFSSWNGNIPMDLSFGFCSTPRNALHWRKFMKRLFRFWYVNFLIFGGIATTVGATLPMVIRHFEWSYLAAGGMFAGSAVGYFGATFVTGLILPRCGVRRVMMSGWLLQALGLGFFGMQESQALNFLLFVLLGLGQGAVEVSTNVGVVNLEAPGKSRLMNLVHSAFTIGAMVAPFMAGMLEWFQVSWRFVYAGMALSAMTMLAWSFGKASMLKHSLSEQVIPVKSEASNGIFRDPLLLLMASIIFFYVGAEIGISNWIAEYFVTIHHRSPAMGAMMVALFWSGIFIGRMVLGIGYAGNRLGLNLVFCSLLSVLSLALALRSNQAWSAGLFFLITGVGYSIVYPCVMSLVGILFPDDKSQAIGLVSTSGGLGVFFFPFAMSVVAARFGLDQGFRFYLLLTILMSLCAVFTAWLIKKRNGIDHDGAVE